MDLQVRDARITDIERIMALLGRARHDMLHGEPEDVADLMRRMVYLPNASLSLAVDGREAVGAALLTLRPSVSAGGPIGTLDLFVHAANGETGQVVEALLTEIVRSARNKGCVLIEAPIPTDDDELARWRALGFSDTGARLGRSITHAPAAAR